MRLTSLKLETVQDLLLAELRDLYNAENQLVDALAEITDAASSTELKQTFTHHLEETKQHVMRLDDVFRILEEDP